MYRSADAHGEASSVKEMLYNSFHTYEIERLYLTIAILILVRYRGYRFEAEVRPTAIRNRLSQAHLGRGQEAGVKCTS